MLVARKEPEGPAWKSVMGAQILFAPIDRAMLRRARRAALKALGREGDGPQDDSEDRALEQMEELGDALSFALIMEGVRDWRDVASQLLDDQGEPALDGAGAAQFEPLPFTAENLAATLSDPIVFEAFDAAYVMPFAARERAKNGFAASQNGTGPAAMQGNGTASSPAKRKPRGGAKPAPTGSKRRTTKKPRVSGKS